MCAFAVTMFNNIYINFDFDKIVAATAENTFWSQTHTVGVYY